RPNGSDEAAPAASVGAAIDVMVPTLGESVTEATVSTWFKAEGDSVAADEMLCELETDKVSVEVPAPAAGTLTKILAKEGDTVQAAGKLAEMGTSGGAAATKTADPAPAPAAASGSTAKDIGHAPSAQKAMAEKGLSPDQVTGTGRDGRIMKEDVAKAAAAAAATPAPAAAPA
ncbi:MAG: biotin/lipoyl-containing protein, partial [Pseudomonadota bacterium]